MSKLPGATSEGGFQFYLLMTTVSEMHPVFVMAGHCHQPQLSATVAQPSQQTMRNDFYQRATSQLEGITSYVT